MEPHAASAPALRRISSDSAPSHRSDGVPRGGARDEGHRPVSSDPAPRTVIVVFVDHNECRWLRVLERGFRHCFAAVREGSSWIVCDPLKDRIALTLAPVPRNFDLAGFYAGQGHEVLVGRLRPDRPRDRLAFAPLTCVAVVKRIIGIEAAHVLTPRQLFRHLSEAQGGSFVRYGPDPCLQPRRKAEAATPAVEA